MFSRVYRLNMSKMVMTIVKLMAVKWWSRSRWHVISLRIMRETAHHQLSQRERVICFLPPQSSVDRCIADFCVDTLLHWLTYQCRSVILVHHHPSRDSASCFVFDFHGQNKKYRDLLSVTTCFPLIFILHHLYFSPCSSGLLSRLLISLPLVTLTPPRH